MKRGRALANSPARRLLQCGVQRGGRGVGAFAMWSWLRGFHATATGRLLALAVAYLLVAQAVFAGLAAGADAGTFSLDRTLAISLCAPGEASAGNAADHGSPRHDTATCCIAGCTASGNAILATTAHVETVRHRSFSGLKPESGDTRFALPAIRSPVHPRAPPVSH